MSVMQYNRVPRLSEALLREHQVFEQGDSRFRAAARLQQALWRIEKGYAIGTFSRDGENDRPIGNYISSELGDAGCNFINEDIAKLVRRELAYAEPGASLEERRLRTNALSSMPLVFNLFGAMKLNHKLATAFARRVFPDYVKRVHEVLFEHSPGRRIQKFSFDGSAFDAAFQIETQNGERGFIGFEVKFSEDLLEGDAKLRDRYTELSVSSGMFIDPMSEALRAAPLQQIWRQTLLAASMLEAGLYNSARFCLIAPALNPAPWQAVESFRNHLNPDGPIAFDAITLEAAVAAIRNSGARDIAAALEERYLSWQAVEQLVEAN